MGIEGTRVDVILKQEESHHHRNLKDVEDIINSSLLNEEVKKLSLKMFNKVAEAESKIHGKPIYEIHFHEVGAVDSIVDIVGAAICLLYLKVDKVMCSTVEVGSGFVKCAHGILPVPAPATAEILIGIPIKSLNVPFEATTPTGAAILSATVNSFTDKKEFAIVKIGYGLGKKDGIVPNILRVYLGEEDTKETTDAEEVILQCNIDDMNTENYDYIMERLFNSGAKDVYLTNIIMKKGRPGIMLSVLCENDKEKELKEIIFRESSTIGLRKYGVHKEMLYRENSKILTSLGEIRVKTVFYKGEQLKHKFEYEDCKKLAKENMLPITKVYEEAENYLFNMKSKG
jgi:uncharacterized protein (TIGR00299 family) protein